TSELADGPVHLSVVGVGEKRPLGFVALVHDLSYVQHRENTTRNHLLLAFFLLALSAAGVTLFAARFAWHGWIKEFSEALTGEPTKDILPLVRYLRELVERITQERVEEPREGRWDAERLRRALRQHLHGERVVIVANREPYVHEKKESGAIEV